LAISDTCSRPSTPGHHFDERTKVRDALHAAHVHLVEFGRCRQLLNDADRHLRRGIVRRRDVDAAVVFDIDLDARALDDRADGLATRADALASLLDRNLDRDDAERLRHLAQDVQATLAPPVRAPCA